MTMKKMTKTTAEEKVKTSTMPTPEWGSHDECLSSPTEQHEPDYEAEVADAESDDGDQVNISVVCRHCGRMGVVDGTVCW